MEPFSGSYSNAHSHSLSGAEMASHTHSLSNHVHNINTLNPEVASHTHLGSYTSDSVMSFTCCQCSTWIVGVVNTYGGLTYCTSCYPIWTNTRSSGTVVFTLPSTHSDEEVKDLKNQLKSAEDRVQWYKDSMADNISWYEDQARNQDRLIVKLEECLRTPEPELVSEGQWVNDVSQNKGPYWTVRETLVDIESNKRAHRVPGWVLRDKKGKYLELPTVVLTTNSCTYPIKHMYRAPNVVDAAISIPLVGISLYYLMSLVYNVI